MSGLSGFEAMCRLLGALPRDTRLRLVAMYRASLAAHLDSLAAALATGAHDEAKSLAHRMAGSAAMMQDAGLSQPARAMEASLCDGQPQEALRLWPLVQQRAGLTLHALREQAPCSQ